jgi:maleate isomerase
LLSALTHLGVRRVATATPYDDHVADRWTSFLDEAGIEVATSAHLGLTSEIRSVPYEATMQLVRDADSPDAEAIVVACTNLATYDVIAPLEAELGKPVVTANQATMWTLLEAIGRRAVGPHQWLITGPTVGSPGQRRRGFDG